MSTLQDLKQELSRFGANNDAVETARGKRMLNITPETGELLALLVHATDPPPIAGPLASRDFDLLTHPR